MEMDSCGETAAAASVTSLTPSLRDSSTFAYSAADELLALHNWYQRYHGYLASVVCVFGIVANTLNIVVLTRPNMISSTNCILTGLTIPSPAYKMRCTAAHTTIITLH